MSKPRRVATLCFLLAVAVVCPAVESGMYRLLSVSETEKLILVSQIPSKTRYLLDAGTAKITVNGKPAEFRELKSFSIIQIKADLKKANKMGIGIDGTATEIKVSPLDKGK